MVCFCFRLRNEFTNFRHWVDKNCVPWTKEYFNSNIKGVSYEDDEYRLEISTVESISGDCDVTQRKGKVLCIYDLVLNLAITGTSISDERDFSGSVKIPEFVHDQDEDEYVFDITADTYVSDVRKKLIPVLKSKLLKFQNDLIKAHENDVQHSAN